MVYIPDNVREAVHKQANGYCEYCYASEDIIISMEIDHIKAIAAGGETVLDNLCLTCVPCNRHKAQRQVAIDPVTQTEVALFNPRTQIWSEHFVWSQDFSTILGLSATGRATVDCLQMNRANVAKARQRWRICGWQPPSA